MIRVKDKGEFYVNQDANWNVIGLTDMGGRVAERYVYRPYGELTVHQESGFGDVDGDGDCDAADKTFADDFCDGGLWADECKVMDLDFDGDWDSADLTLWNLLPSGALQAPGKTSTGVEQPFAHQGLLFDAELASYQNRARQYDPNKRRFVQRDPLNASLTARHLSRVQSRYYTYLESNPGRFTDSLGEDIDYNLPPENYPITEEEANNNSSFCKNGPGHEENNCYRGIPSERGGSSKHLCFTKGGDSAGVIDFVQSHTDSIGGATGKGNSGKCIYDLCLVLLHISADVLGDGVTGIPPPIL